MRLSTLAIGCLALAAWLAVVPNATAHTHDCSNQVDTHCSMWDCGNPNWKQCDAYCTEHQNDHPPPCNWWNCDVFLQPGNGYLCLWPITGQHDLLCEGPQPQVEALCQPF
ncbi:MAG: hypothetical protein V4510_06555 [bacterium]